MIETQEQLLATIARRDNLKLKKEALLAEIRSLRNQIGALNLEIDAYDKRQFEAAPKPKRRSCAD